MGQTVCAQPVDACIVQSPDEGGKLYWAYSSGKPFFEEKNSFEEALRALEGAAGDLATRYRAALASETDRSEELEKADASIGRVQEQLRRLRSLRAQSKSEKGKGKLGDDTQSDAVANDWLDLFGGPQRRLGSLKKIVKRVQTQTRVLRLWKALTPPKPRKSKVFHTLKANGHRYDLDSWEVDVFQIDSETNQSLVHIFMAGWWGRHMDKLSVVEENKVVEFATALQSAYKQNPYHNRMHAADVMASSYYLVGKMLAQPGMEEYFTDLDMMCMHIACAIHDVAHPGFSNAFLVNTRDALAIRYNDVSVLESFHAATGFAMMHDLNADLLNHTLPGPPVPSLRRRVIHMVLATDMAHHKQTMEELASEIAIHELQDVDKLALEKHLVHCADVGHPLRPFKVHEQWSRRVTEEFFLQGDQEKRLGLQPLALFNRNEAPPLAAGQIGFLNFVVKPMWQVLARVLRDGGEEPEECLAENLTKWENLAHAAARRQTEENI